MNSSFLYAALTLVCSVSILMIWLRVNVLSERTVIRTPFLLLLSFFILFTLVDTAWSIINTKIFPNSQQLLTIITYSYLITVAVIVFLWTGFICSYLGVSTKIRSITDTGRMIFLSAQIVILAANMKTHFAFYFETDCSYVVLPPRDIIYQLQLSQPVLIILFSTIQFPLGKNTARKLNLAAAISFSAILFVFGMGQMKYPEIPFYSMGFMIISIAIFLTTVTHEREQDEQQRESLITGLSDDYESVSLVNLDADTIETIRETAGFRARHKGNNEKKYSVFNEKALQYVHPEDRATFHREMSPENIRAKLKQQKSFYVSYRQYIDNAILFYRLKVLRTDNWEKNSEFMVGTSNVDELIRNQLLLSEENTRKTSVLNALAGSYESVCYVDLETLTYIPFFGTEELKQWYKTDSYRNDFSAYIHEKVVSEYREPLLSAVSEESFEKYRQSAEVGNEAFHFQQFLVEISGTQTWCEFSLSRIDDTHIIATIQNRDAIIRNDLEQKRILAEAKEKAEAASRAKTTFLFNMSHDIRTPMNAVKGFIELAERNLEKNDKVADYLSKAKTSSEHLLKLINDILDMSRIESGKTTIDPVPTDIRAETDKLMAILGLSAKEKGIEFTADISAIRNNFIYSDILHMNQILLNIVSNAIKYTKPGGKVAFTIQQLEDVEEDMSSYCISVADTGVGMSKGFQKHIYEEFSRAQNTTQSGVEGTGLGMSIVKRLVDMMGGAIEIESELGKGTIVQLYLTFKTAEDCSILPVETAVPETNLSGKKLLLVDDNELNREIACDILEFEGLSIEEAEDGAIAVEKIRMHRPDYYDFVLMDIQMPYMDGYQATRAIRNLDNADYTHLPVIAMTANVFEDDVKNALDAGMNGHLSKPINVPDLINCLKKMARK